MKNKFLPAWYPQKAYVEQSQGIKHSYLATLF